MPKLESTTIIWIINHGFIYPNYNYNAITKEQNTFCQTTIEKRNWPRPNMEHTTFFSNHAERNNQLEADRHSWNKLTCRLLKKSGAYSPGCKLPTCFYPKANIRLQLGWTIKEPSYFLWRGSCKSPHFGLDHMWYPTTTLISTSVLLLRYMQMSFTNNGERVGKSFEYPGINHCSSLLVLQN